MRSAKSGVRLTYPRAVRGGVLPETTPVMQPVKGTALPAYPCGISCGFFSGAISTSPAAFFGQSKVWKSIIGRGNSPRAAVRGTNSIHRRHRAGLTRCGGTKSWHNERPAPKGPKTWIGAGARAGGQVVFATLALKKTQKKDSLEGKTTLRGVC